MFYIAVWLILLIVICIIENKEPKINDFGAIFGEIEFTQWQTIFMILCCVCGKVQLLCTYHV